MIDVLAEALKRAFGFFRGPLRWLLPFFPRRVGSARKIDAIPKLFMDPFARMVEDADQSAAIFGAQTVGDGRDFLFGWLDCGRIVQLHPRVISAHVKDVQRARKPKRFLIQANMRSFIDVARHSIWRDTDLLEAR